MKLVGLPVIVLVCYITGEIIKVLFKNKKELFKIIPMLLALLGGILGVVMYLTSKDEMFNLDSVWTALMIGIVSGLSSTGTNQIYKQIKKKEEGK